MEPNKVAVFIDYECLFYGMLNEHKSYYNLVDLRGLLAGFGRVVVSRAYADFRTPILKDEPQRLDNVAISAIQCDADGRKNYTDFYLLNDIYETLIDNPNINTYVVVTGDGHFKGVLAKLKFKHQKNVIVISVKGCANKALKNFTLYELESQDTRLKAIRYIDKNINEYSYITFQQAVKRAERDLGINIYPVLSQLVDEGVIQKKIANVNGRGSTILALDLLNPEVAAALDYSVAS